MMFQRTLFILMECKEVWPLASRWVDALERVAQDPTSSLTNESGMADGKDQIPHPVVGPPAAGSTSSGTSPASSIYGRQGNSLESSSTLQSASPHDILDPLATSHIIPSHFPSVQVQQQPQPHQLHPHHQQQQQPSPSAMLQPQAFVPHQLHPHLYMGPDSSHNLDMVMGPFDQSAIQGYPITPQCNPPLAATIATAAAIPPVPLNPSADGYEGELNFYVYGPQDWMPTSNIFDGYN